MTPWLFRPKPSSWVVLLPLVLEPAVPGGLLRPKRVLLAASPPAAEARADASEDVEAPAVTVALAGLLLVDCLREPSRAWDFLPPAASRVVRMLCWVPWGSVAGAVTGLGTYLASKSCAL